MIQMFFKYKPHFTDHSALLQHIQWQLSITMATQVYQAMQVFCLELNNRGLVFLVNSENGCLLQIKSQFLRLTISRRWGIKYKNTTFFQTSLICTCASCSSFSELTVVLYDKVHFTIKPWSNNTWFGFFP